MIMMMMIIITTTIMMTLNDKSSIDFLCFLLLFETIKVTKCGFIGQSICHNPKKIRSSQQADEKKI